MYTILASADDVAEASIDVRILKILVIALKTDITISIQNSFLETLKFSLRTTNKIAVLKTVILSDY